MSPRFTLSIVLSLIILLQSVSNAELEWVHDRRLEIDESCESLPDDWKSILNSAEHFGESNLRFTELKKLGHDAISLFGQSLETEDLDDYMGSNNEKGKESPIPPTERMQRDLSASDDSVDWSEESNDYTEETGASDLSLTVSGSSVLPEEHKYHNDNNDVKWPEEELWLTQDDDIEEQLHLLGMSLSGDDFGMDGKGFESAFSDKPLGFETSSYAETDEQVFGQSVVPGAEENLPNFQETVSSFDDWEEQLNILDSDLKLVGQSVVSRKDHSGKPQKENGLGSDGFKKNSFEEGFELDSVDHEFATSVDFDEQWDGEGPMEYDDSVDRSMFPDFPDEEQNSDEVERGVDLVFSAHDETSTSQGADGIQVEGQSVLSQPDDPLPDYVVEFDKHTEYPGSLGDQWMQEDLVVAGQSLAEDFVDDVPLSESSHDDFYAFQ